MDLEELGCWMAAAKEYQKKIDKAIEQSAKKRRR
jgi:hypothetical protein